MVVDSIGSTRAVVSLLIEIVELSRMKYRHLPFEICGIQLLFCASTAGLLFGAGIAGCDDGSERFVEQA